MEIMSDPNGSEFCNPGEWFKISWKKLDLGIDKISGKKLEREAKNEREHTLKVLKLRATAKKSGSTLILLSMFSFTGSTRGEILDHSKSITSKGEHKAREELQQCEWQLLEREKIFFEKIGGGDWHEGELIENKFEDLKLSWKIEDKFEDLKLSWKMLEMLKHLVQSTLIEPMRDAVVLVTLMYIVVLAYSLAQVRNDWLIHFLVLCAFFCLHIGSYFSEKAANYFYRVKEMEMKMAERWPHDVVLYLHLASATCILPST